MIVRLVAEYVRDGIAHPTGSVCVVPEPDEARRLIEQGYAVRVVPKAKA